MNSQGAISQADVVKSRKRRHVGNHDLAPWLFVAPALIIFAVYVVIPIFQSFWLSLFDWDGITGEKVKAGTNGMGAFAGRDDDPAELSRRGDS